MNELEKAEMVARWAHRGQTDMQGDKYANHAMRVAGNLKAGGYDDIVQVIGWLHDVVEDTHITHADLQDLGFSTRTVRGVQSMTQGKDEPLADYWTRVKANPDSLAVKLYGDIPDNDDPMRRHRAVGSGKMTAAHANKLRNKYADARRFLGGGIPDAAVAHWTEPTFDNM